MRPMLPFTKAEYQESTQRYQRNVRGFTAMALSGLGLWLIAEISAAAIGPIVHFILRLLSVVLIASSINDLLGDERDTTTL